MKPKLRLVHDEQPHGPSERFLRLTRNIKLAANPPTRFEPTKKRPQDIII